MSQRVASNGLRGPGVSIYELTFKGDFINDLKIEGVIIDVPNIHIVWTDGLEVQIASLEELKSCRNTKCL